MGNVFSWFTANGVEALAAQVTHSTDLSILAHQLELRPPRPVIVLVGGAKGFGTSDQEHLYPLFFDVLVPLAQSLQIAVIDGGTDAGVMRLMGQIRNKIHATFPLIGVLPSGKVPLPDKPPSTRVAQLEPHHTHFVFVPGTQWGDEALWLAQFASALAQEKPSFTLLVNGGDIAWQDVSESVQHNRPVIVVEGSGRTADALAEALYGRSESLQANKLVTSGLLQLIDLTSNADTILRTFKEMLMPEDIR